MHIAIVGGGIGGLCTAVALAQQNIDVTVFESAASFKPIGAGIGIGSNAMQALVELGVGAQLTTNGTVLKTQIFKDATGKILNTIDFSKLQTLYGQMNITIQRADLHRILFEKLPVGCIKFNKKCVKITQLEHSCILYFSDGSHTISDYIIAADGIHSTIRQQLLPSSITRYAGYTCWRGIADNKDFIAPDTSTELWHASGRFGYAPLSHDKIYWFACVNAQPHDEFLKRLEKEQIASIFHQFPNVVKQIILATPPNTILHHDLYDLKPLKTFHYTRVLLLGDAAHATTPNMGQGAGQAIEDALCFAQLLQRSTSFDEAAQQYDQQRVRKTARVTRLSRQIGQAAQWTNPIATATRDFLFPFIPSSLLLKRLKFLYKR